MEKFFTQGTCDRCGGSLKAGRAVSMFNNDCICVNCENVERNSVIVLNIPQKTKRGEK